MMRCRSTEIAVMGMFAEKKGDAWDSFQRVCAEFETDSGIALGYTTAKAVYSRYLEEGMTTPAILIFSSFSPETGEIQKGKKARMYFQGE